VKVKPGAGIGLLLLESINGTARFNVPSTGGIAINSTNPYTSFALRVDLGFNAGIVFRTEISD
jgi:hypothetical protein